MKLIPLVLTLLSTSIATAMADICICSYFPPCFGSKTITDKDFKESFIFLAGTPYNELNGNVVCQGNPLAATQAPEKMCNRSATASINGEITLGGKFGKEQWASIGLSVRAGVSYTTACAAKINSWCQCCICVCYIPLKVTTAYGTCSATCYLPGDSTDDSYPCSKPIIDTANSYGWLQCTTTWDVKPVDGRDDCWNAMPNPCKTSCETGS